MIIEEIYVQRDNKKNVLLTVVMLAVDNAVDNAVINSTGNMGTTGNIIILIASKRKTPRGWRRAKATVASLGLATRRPK